MEDAASAKGETRVNMNAVIVCWITVRFSG